MKSKVMKMVGVLVALSTLATMLVGTAAPASAAPGTNAWGSVAPPSAINNILGGDSYTLAAPTTVVPIGNPDVNLLVAAADGKTIFAIDSHLAPTASTTVYKSTDAGVTWNTSVAVAAASAALAIAISPNFATDNTVIFADASEVWMSNNAGTTFQNVAPVALQTQIETIGGGTLTSIAIAPYYANNTLTILVGSKGGAGLNSNVQKFTLGGFAWESVGALTTAGVGGAVFDPGVVAVAFSPAHLTDAELLCVYTNTIAGSTFLSSHFGALEWNAFLPARQIGPTVVPGPNGGAATSAVIAMASDYVGNSGTPILVGLNGTDAVAPAVSNDDLYRITGRSAAAGAASDLGIGGTGTSTSIAGIVSAGPAATANTFITQPGSAVLTKVTGAFSGTLTVGIISKGPTGSTGVSPAWLAADGTKAIAGTAGTDSAISLSSDSAATFNQVGLIDVGPTTLGAVGALTLTAGGSGFTGPAVVTITDTAPGVGAGATATATIAAGVVTSITLTAAGSGFTGPVVVTITDGAVIPTGVGATATATLSGSGLFTVALTNMTVVDANTAFLVMANTTAAPALGQLLQYVFKTADGGTSWVRIKSSTVPVATAPLMLAQSGAYATDSTVFLSDGTGLLQKSVNGGNTFTALNTPAPAISAVFAVDGSNAYIGMLGGVNKIGRFSTSTGVSATATVRSIAMNPKDATKATFAVGTSAGTVYTSTNDVVSFAIVGTGSVGGVAENVRVAYAADGTLYAASLTAGVFRYTGTAWVLLKAPGATGVSGLAVTADGALYMSDATAAAGADPTTAATAGGVWRTLKPTAATALLAEVQNMDFNTASGFPTTGIGGKAMDMDVVSAATGNTVYILDTTTATTAAHGQPLYPGKIYAFVDALAAAPVPTAPAAAALLTTETTAALSWAAVASATSYAVVLDGATEVGTSAGTPTAITIGVVTSPATALNTALVGGTSHTWSFRVTAPLFSRQSVTRTFTTALPAVTPVTTATLPLLGAVEVPIDSTFTWPSVIGATSYEFVIAEDLGNADKFAIIDYSATTDTNAHKLRENLKYNTVYYWRVRAANATTKGPWIVFFFTTAKAPPPPTTTAAPTATVAPAPQPIITITPAPPAPEITLQIPPAPAPVQVIPPYLLWAVIAVGAILIIAVIVLIVRTRRIS